MTIIIPEDFIFKETIVEGNLKCPICERTLVISGFLGQVVTGHDTNCWCYAYCINCNKYFKSVKKEE